MSDLMPWIIGGLVVLVIAVVVFAKRAQLKGLAKELNPFSLKGWLALIWIVAIGAGTYRLYQARSLDVRAARELPAGSLLETGDVVVGSGFPVTRRAIAQDQTISRSDLVDAKGGTVAPTAKFELVGTAQGADLSRLSADRAGWICPAAGATTKVQVTSIQCRDGDSACFAVIAFPPDAAAVVAVGKASGLRSQPCGRR